MIKSCRIKTKPVDYANLSSQHYLRINYDITFNYEKIYCYI